MALGGGIFWLYILFRNFTTRLPLSIFELLFLLAPWVVVPLTLGLVPETSASRFERLTSAAIRTLLFPAATLATLSFLASGWKAGALTCLWLIVGLALAADGLNRLIRTRLQSFQQFCFAIGEGYALVGALWLLASRLGLQLLGFHEPIVLLTAIHFHYAGLMAAVLAGLVASESRATRSSLALHIALSCAVLGPCLLGLAFLAGPKMKLAAVGLLVIGECGLAFGMFRIGLTDAARIGGQMLLLGSACVIFGMALAGIWAAGEYPLHPFVNLEQMARYHGVLNSVGFGLCSLVGWTLLRRKPQQVLEPS